MQNQVAPERREEWTNNSFEYTKEENLNERFLLLSILYIFCFKITYVFKLICSSVAWKPNGRLILVQQESNNLDLLIDFTTICVNWIPNLS